jgi:hypothetical protein
MALTAAQLADLVTKTKMYLRKSDDDASLLQEGLTVYHDESDSATAATVAVNDVDDELSLVVTGGSNAGTYNVDFTDADYDTMTEVVDRINGINKGFVADLIGDPNALGTSLRPVTAVDCFGSSKMQTLRYTDNAALELIIQQCFDAIESACGRSFFAADYDERVFTSNNRWLTLEQPDVQRVTFLALETYDGMRISYDGSGQRASVEVTDTTIRLVARTGATDTETTYTFSEAAYDTIGELVTTIDALADWSATLLNDGPSKFLIRRPAVAVKTFNGTQNITVESWQQTDSDYDLDYEGGVVSLSFVPPYGICRILYRAGFDSLPTPVERELLRMVKGQYESLSRDSAAKSMRLGDYAISTEPEMVAYSLDADNVVRRLSRYVRSLP